MFQSCPSCPFREARPWLRRSSSHRVTPSLWLRLLETRYMPRIFWEFGLRHGDFCWLTELKKKKATKSHRDWKAKTSREVIRKERAFWFSWGSIISPKKLKGAHTILLCLYMVHSLFLTGFFYWGSCSQKFFFCSKQDTKITQHF